MSETFPQNWLVSGRDERTGKAHVVVTLAVKDTIGGEVRTADITLPFHPDDTGPNIVSVVDPAHGATELRYIAFYGHPEREMSATRFCVNAFNTLTGEPIHREFGRDHQRTFSGSVSSPMKPAEAESVSEQVFTKSQGELMERIRLYADVYRSKKTDGSGHLDCEVNILVAGPTGTGKSHAIQAAAESCGMQYFPVSYSNWIPSGATARSTLVSLAKVIVERPENSIVLLHIDELDKMRAETDWAVSLCSEVYGVIEGRVNATWLAEEYVKRDVLVKEGESADGKIEAISLRLAWAFKFGLMVVGSGTWQDLHDSAKATLGFGAAVNGDPFRSGAKIPDLPWELRRRFHSDVHVMEYPDADETKVLLARHGLSALAESLGEAPPHIEWSTMGGMGCLRSIATSLVAKQIAARRDGGSMAQSPATPGKQLVFCENHARKP